MHQCQVTSNVSIHYVNDLIQATDFPKGMGEEEGWVVIDYTRERFNDEVIDQMKLNSELNAHMVLGQEFDKVLVLTGPAFYYDVENKLCMDKTNHYDPERISYQSVTRARKSLCY